MSVRRLTWALVVCVILGTWPLTAGELVPFYGEWTGVTISAAPTNDPGVVLVVSGGSGVATQLGAFQMVSPHLTYLATFVVEGTQAFVAANGDALDATISGQFTPQPDGSLTATLHGVITGGTGRFEGATGTYDFEIVSRPTGTGGFASTAAIDGLIAP